jgi:hypothetical protein
MIRMVDPGMAHLHESDMHSVTLQVAFAMNQFLEVEDRFGRGDGDIEKAPIVFNQTAEIIVFSLFDSLVESGFVQECLHPDP